jgi:methylmalonyl-CoA/ethylmalonyl-CoA epimerase
MITQKYKLTFHHTGCLTRDIEATKTVYAGMGFGDFSETYTVSDQKVKVCFIEMSQGVFLELVEPIGDNVPLNKMLKNKVSFYHLGYLTDEFEKVVQDLQNDGFYLLNSFRSEAFSGRYCAFLYTPEMQLIEIIER